MVTRTALTNHGGGGWQRPKPAGAPPSTCFELRQRHSRSFRTLSIVRILPCFGTQRLLPARTFLFCLIQFIFFLSFAKPSPTAAPCSTTLFSEVGIHWLPGTFRYVLQVVYVLCLYPVSYMTALQNTKKFSKKKFPSLLNFADLT